MIGVCEYISTTCTFYCIGCHVQTMHTSIIICIAQTIIISNDVETNPGPTYDAKLLTPRLFFLSVIWQL